MKEQISPLIKLLAVFGIAPTLRFKPYDKVIPHPFIEGETLTLRTDRPNGTRLVNPEALWGEQSQAAYKAFLNKPAAPKNG